MGAKTSQLNGGGQELGVNEISSMNKDESCNNDKYFGPFRHHVQDYKRTAKDTLLAKNDDLLTCLSELFQQITSQKKTTGVLAPRKFVGQLKKENELFRSYMHQDAHEFIIYLLNVIAEILIKDEQEQKILQLNQSMVHKILESGTVPGMENSDHATLTHGDRATWLHGIFEGILSNETKCLCCETITTKEEAFLDLSVEINQNSSISSCLTNFSMPELLRDKNKFYCDACCSLQEAEKRMLIKKAPNVLVLHLKRFKYVESLQRYRKLSYRVLFPLELRLQNTSEDSQDSDRIYDLFAVITHIGTSPTHGHYIAMVRSGHHWYIFDDDNVKTIEESQIHAYFYASNDSNSACESGYVLLYQNRSYSSITTLTPTVTNKTIIPSPSLPSFVNIIN